MRQVLEEMQREREDDLCSQADGLAMQMATIHYQKAERRTKVLETSRAMLILHNLLIQQLRERKSLERDDMAQSIQSHCLVGTVLVICFGIKQLLNLSVTLRKLILNIFSFPLTHRHLF